MLNTEHPYYAEVKSLLERLVAGGALLNRVYDEEGSEYTPTPEKALEAILAVDECVLSVRTPEGTRVRLDILLGNDPGELVSDYTVDPFLERITTEHWDAWDRSNHEDTPPGPWYVSTCLDTHRVFVCQTGVDNNICEVFSRGPCETVGDNAQLIADSLNLTQRLSP